MRKLDARALRAAIEQTFAYRATHSVPSELPAPAEGWRRPYARLATRDALPWADLDAVTAAARGFLDPVLAGSAGIWGPTFWRWDDGE